jgi:hypothetical protein
MLKATLAVALIGACGHNQVDGLQDVGLFESEPRRAQGFDPFVCFADSAFSDVAWIMKRTYSDEVSAETATRDHPSYYEITKEQGLTGDSFRYAVKTGNPQSISGTYTAAAAAANGNSGVIIGQQFSAEPRLKYGVLKMDRPSILRASLKGRGAFYEWVTEQVDGVLEEMGARLAFDMFGDGNGIRGRRTSISGNEVTLTDAKTADRFKVGMVLGASVNSDGSSPRAGTTYVTRINRGANKITLNDASAIAGFVDGDNLFVSAEPGTCIEGMGLATPLSAPTSSDSFRGVNRYADVEALAGSRRDDSSSFADEVLGDLAVDVHCMNQTISRGVVHPVKFQDIVKRLGAKVTYTNPGGNADIGFESIDIHAAGKQIRLMSDPDIQYTRTRGWDPKAHKIVYLGPKVVHWVRTSDGGQFQWSSSADSFEYRACFYGNYLQPNQARHVVGSLSG